MHTFYMAAWFIVLLKVIRVMEIILFLNAKEKYNPKRDFTYINFFYKLKTLEKHVGGCFSFFIQKQTINASSGSNSPKNSNCQLPPSNNFSFSVLLETILTNCFKFSGWHWRKQQWKLFVCRRNAPACPLSYDVCTILFIRSILGIHFEEEQVSLIWNKIEITF